MRYLQILRNTACRSALLLALPGLGGCQETLIFFEQTAFKLGISVNEEPPVPLEVTVGLKRRVVAISPPKKPLQTNAAGGRRADGEAVSLLSRFDVIYRPDETGAASPGNPFGGKLTIISAFASGGAAVTIAADPVATALVVDPVGLLGNELTRAKLAQEQRRDAMFRAIDTIAGDRARSLAMSPPTPIDPAMANVVAAVDPNGQRGVDDAAARRVLKAWVPELPVSDYAAWEAALGVQ
jgi:hypothetical protein